jgi:protein-disulfide isomerase
MKLSRQVVVTSLVVIVIVAVFAVLVTRQLGSEPEERGTGERAAIATRPDSHRLDTADDGAVTLVEFTDFECPSCRAAQPFVEQLRQKYAGRVTFVIRYFPLDIHPHAREAAYAVEAAARQGRFEEMHDRMFETQTEWSGSSQPPAALFRTFAEELGLDLKTYDADVAADEVAARVQADVDDGLTLGVSGTPTFLLNGDTVDAETTDEFVQRIDDALAG